MVASQGTRPSIAITVLVAFAFLFCDTLAERADNEQPELVPIGLQKQLLVDHYAIDTVENLTFELGETTKANHGQPVLAPDKPWENLAGSFGSYATAMYEGGRFRMWYRASGSLLGYAESHDGIHWNKPELGLVYYEGSRENNLVDREIGNGLSVFRDTHETDPEHRYKICYAGPGTRAALGYSEDGFLWKKYNAGEPVTGRAADTYNQLLWDEIANVYRLYTRTDYQTIVGSEMEVRGTRGMINADVKSDPTNWTTTGNWRLDREDPEDYRRRQNYAMTVWIYEGIYFALMNVYEWPMDFSEGPQDLWKRHERDIINYYIATSRDGDTWDFTWVYRGEPIVQRGPDGSFDKDMVFSNSNIVTHDDQHWLYYTGHRERHWIDSPAPPAIGLATLPLDRFVCLQAGNEIGVMTTRPFLLEGGDLWLNTEAAMGSIYVEVLDNERAPIPGFTRAEVKAIEGVDRLRCPVTWNGETGLESLIGRVVHLRFYLCRAKLFAFQVQ
jgi:hypothetical protein